MRKFLMNQSKITLELQISVQMVDWLINFCPGSFLDVLARFGSVGWVNTGQAKSITIKPLVLWFGTVTNEFDLSESLIWLMFLKRLQSGLSRSLRGTVEHRATSSQSGVLLIKPQVITSKLLSKSNWPCFSSFAPAFQLRFQLLPIQQFTRQSLARVLGQSRIKIPTSPSLFTGPTRGFQTSTDRTSNRNPGQLAGLPHWLHREFPSNLLRVGRHGDRSPLIPKPPFDLRNHGNHVRFPIHAMGLFSQLLLVRILRDFGKV